MTSRGPSGVQTWKLRSSGMGSGCADVGLAPPLRQPVGHAAVDLVGGLPGPAGVGADDPDLLAGPDALGQAVPALVRLPAAHRGQAGVGLVALGDPVPDDPDLGGEILLRLALRRRDDLLVPGGAGELAGEPLAVHLEQGGRGRGLALPICGTFPEPAQVERQVFVRLGGARGRRGLLEPAPFGISGQVVRGVGTVRTAEGRSGPLPSRSSVCTVKKRSLTWRW